MQIPIRHLVIRLLILPILIGLFYGTLVLTQVTLPNSITKIRFAVYIAAALTALSLMAEAITLFRHRKYDKLICNLGTVLIIIFFIVFTIQLL